VERTGANGTGVLLDLAMAHYGFLKSYWRIFMARRHEAVTLLRKGYSPIKIANRMNITISSVIQYLYQQVGEGAIKRSDIVFGIDKNLRKMVESIISERDTRYWYDIFKTARIKYKLNLNPDELKLYLSLRDARVSLGDMYEIISDIELLLHKGIKQTLINEYGSHENGWWRQGVLESIRKTCVMLRESDPEPAKEPFCYTNFIDLSSIIDKRWGLFTNVLPKNVVKNKQEFLSKFVKLNHIRNKVMHPIKELLITEEDFEFVRNFYSTIKLDNWQISF
jgi:predicted transcriptional regulator